jgi:hypothetical protein
VAHGAGEVQVQMGFGELFERANRGLSGFALVMAEAARTSHGPGFSGFALVMAEAARTSHGPGFSGFALVMVAVRGAPHRR